MSFKASPLPDAASIERFSWSPVNASPAQASLATRPHPEGTADLDLRVAEMERDAFSKGYLQGERAGTEAAAGRSEDMLRRLTQTIEELSAFRAEVIRRTERQAVQLVLALAERVVGREVSLDRGILIGMARAALDRLGEFGSATIRLHPDDYNAVAIGRTLEDGQVRVVADPQVGRGGCRVQSDYGFMDASPEAQFRELGRALLCDEEASSTDADHTHGLVVS